MDRKIRLEEVVKASKSTRQFLSLSGLGVTYSRNGLYAFYMLTNGLLALSLLAYSMYYYKQKIEKLAVIVHHAMLNLDVCAASAIGYVWKCETDNLLNEAYWSYDYQSPVIKEKLNQIKKEGSENLRVMFKYLKCSTIYAIVNINALAAIEGYLMGNNKQTLYPCWFPFELDNFLVYIAVLLWQEVMMTHFIVVTFATLALFHYIYSHVKTEIDLLMFAIDSIEMRAYEMAGGRGKESINPDLIKRCYLRCTRMCAQHHSNIIRYFNSGTNTIETAYFLVLLTGLVLCICTGFALISDNMALKVKFIGIMVLQIIFLYVICWIPEALAKASLQVSDTIFLMDWYKLPKECRSIMMVMLIRSKKPLLMKMLTGTKVDLEGYMDLIKASYSYFNMMLTTLQ